MIVVVSGTHASGKSTLVHDLVSPRPDAVALPDPYELLDDAPDEPDAETFFQQAMLSAQRLRVDHDVDLVVAERGPLDFVAYLEALERLGRPTRSVSLLARSRRLAAEAMGAVDLLVVLHAGDVEAPGDEDPELREAMAAALLDLVDDGELLGGATVLEVAGDPAARRAAVGAALDRPARRRVPSPRED